MADSTTVKAVANAASDMGLPSNTNTIGFTMGFLAAAATNHSDKGKGNQYSDCEDGWWTKWNGPDVDLTLDQKVERAASIAEEVTKDLVRILQLHIRSFFFLTKSTFYTSTFSFSPDSILTFAEVLFVVMVTFAWSTTVSL
jgi:hypothetical protein